MSERDAHDTVEQSLDEFESPMTVRESARQQVRSRQPTAQGMPALGPDGRPRVGTTPGMPAMAPILAPVVLAPEVSPPDGPTDPDGVPRLDPSWEGPTDPEPTPTVIDGDVSKLPKPPKPTVPAPDAPKVLLSPTMELEALRVEEAAQLRRERKAAEKALGARAPKKVAGPATEVLPAIQRKRAKAAKKGSDLPLAIGLAVLVAIIAGVVGALVFVSIGSRPSHPAPPASGPGP